MKSKYTLSDICNLENITIPKEFIPLANDDISMITCLGSRMRKGGALFPRGLNEKGKKASYSLNENSARRAYENGAKFIFSKEQYYKENGEKLPCIIIDDPNKTFIKLCQQIRNEFSDDTKTIAITGSVGKTSTTNMVGIVASENRNTYFSKKNSNGFASIGNHMQNITDDIEVYIQEVGAYHPRLVEDGALILQPDACIVTNIGPSHIDLYGSIEAIAYDKLAVARHLKPNGMAFLNYDDPILRKSELDCSVTWFSLNDNNADYYADNIVYREGYIEYDIIEKKEKTHIILNCYGFHNIINSIAAYAVGRWLGLTGKEIADALLKFKVEGMRENLCNVGGYRLFIDCFNSAPNSLEGAIKTLTNIEINKGNKRIAVLGDMLKMGDLSEKLHTECGKILSKYNVDKFICYGPFMRYMAEELKKAGKDVLYAENRNILNHYITKYSNPGDLILFKAGHKMALSKTIDQIFGTSFYISDADIILEKGSNFKTEDFSGKIVDNLVEIRKYIGNANKVTIPSQINGKPVYRIGADSFNRKKTIEEINFEEGISNIGYAAFYICSGLKRVTLPSTLKVIERSAFNYCINLEEVEIPESVISIERRAFYDCRSLKRIVIGKNVKSIGEEAFAKCPNITIYCEEGSLAKQYAKENNINYIQIERTSIQREMPLINRAETGYINSNQNSIVFTGEISNVNIKNISDQFKEIKYVFNKVETSICCLAMQVTDFIRNSLYEVGIDLVLGENESGNLYKLGSAAVLYIDANKFDANNIDTAILSDKIQKAREDGIKKIILYILWKKDNSHVPSSEQKNIVQLLQVLDIDLIVGTNGSVIQPYTELKNENKTIPILYSLGSLLNDSKNKRNKTSIFLKLDIFDDIKLSYLPCYVATQLLGIKNLILPINNRKFKSGKFNQLLKEQKCFAQSVVGKRLSVTSDFDLQEGPIIDEEYIYPPYHSFAGVDAHEIYTKDIFFEKISDPQMKILQAYRTTEQFKKSYGEYILSNNPYGEGVQEAIRLIKRFKKLENVTINTHRDLIIDMLYMRNVFGFYCIEYFRYEFENKTLEERLEYIPDRSIIPYFDKLNRDRDAFMMMKDKYKLYQHLKEFYRRDVIRIATESDKQAFDLFVNKHNSFIIKPEAALQAKGVYVINVKDYSSKDALFEELLKNKPLVCEELIIQDKEMAAFHPNSVNCMRIFTYCNGVDSKVLLALLKTGAGGDVVDNGVRGGLAAAVDVKTGNVFTDAYNKHGENFLPQHPDTGVRFKGYQIPKWNELVELSEKAALAMPTTPIIAWDIALATDGWKIVEGNGHGAMFLYQTVTKEGVMKLFLEECEYNRYKED